MKIKLYHYWRSSSSLRVRWALALKGIEFEAIPVNLLEAEEKTADYLKMNPNGYVPTLEIDGVFIGEPMAIMEYLEERFPEPALLPGDLVFKSKLRQLAELINSGVQPLHNLAVMKKVASEKESQFEWNQHWTHRGFSAYEELLESWRQKETMYSLTDTPSVADLCLVASMYSSRRFGVDISKYPVLESIFMNATASEAYQKASPEAYQPKN